LATCQVFSTEFREDTFFSMMQVNVGLRFFAAQKNLTRPTWLPG